MKKLLSLLLVSILVISLMVSCAPSTPEPDQTDTGNTAENPATDGADNSADNAADTQTTTSGDGEKIVVWAWDPNFNIDIMNTAAKFYNETHPDVEFEIVEMAKADVEQKLHTNLASQLTEGLPDIVLIEDYNAQKYLQSYPGSFADLTNEFNYDDFAPYKVELMTLDSKVYGVPFDSGVTGFFYRSDVLEEAGFTADDLSNITWDEFIEIGKTVKETTGKELLSFDAIDGGLMRVMMQSAGSWYFDGDGNLNLENNDALKEAMETYKKISDAGIIKPTSGWNDWVNAFNVGDAVSVSSGAWIIGSVKDAADQSGNWAMAEIPRLNVSASVNSSNLGGSSWYILEGAGNKEGAIEFMKEIYAGNMDFFQEILVNNGAVASYTPAHEGEAYAADDEFFGGQKIYDDLSTYMEGIPSINYGLYTYEADAAIMNQMLDVIDGKITVDEAIAAAAKQLENQIS